jgi:hypothetical protein
MKWEDRKSKQPEVSNCIGLFYSKGFSYSFTNVLLAN